MVLLKKLISCLTAFMITGGMLSGIPSAKAENSAITDSMYEIETVSTDILSYSDYYDLYSSENYPQTLITKNGSDFLNTENGIFSTGAYTDSKGDTRENCLLWKNGGTVSYEFEIAESGNYSVALSYCPVISDSPNIGLSLEIDGKTPYISASHLKLSRVWVNEKEITTDKRGNQIRPVQIQTELWQNTFIGDPDGLFSKPLFVYLEKGKHEISFKSERSDIAVESVTIGNPEPLKSYSEYSAERDNSAEGKFRIEGEDAICKSDSTLYPSSDGTSYLVSPSDPRKVVFNTIGGENWKKPMQTVTWNIPKEKIGNGGWYRIGIKARQNTMRGLYSNRRIYIDDEVPCAELDDVCFYYSSKWQMVCPKADNEDIYVYLSPEKDHTVTLETVTGEIGNSLRRLDEIVTDLNIYYRKVLMITGPSPDKYTDYYVHEKIPGLTDEFSRISAELKSIQNEIESLSDSKGSEAAVLGNLAVILDKCTDKPLKIPNYLSQIKDGIASVSAWSREYRDQPLEIDFIEFAAADEKFSTCRENLWKTIVFSIKSFIGSFFEDYTSLSDVSDDEAIEVWVALGRDQAQIVKEMTEEEFMQKTGIPVSVNLVTGGIVEATLADEGPDVALFLGGEFPVNLAARGLLTDLTQFADYPETEKRFQKSAAVQYTYQNGVYGLPITRNFPMMFCRTDVLSELGIDSAPETWDDLRDILPKMQRNYMSAGLVLPSANISPSTETGHTFAMLVLQQGINYYSEDLTESSFDSIKAVRAFEEWTDFYTKYSFSQYYDAFSRFRTGEYPIVIADYTFFNQLETAAPEIKGTWDFYPVPGTVREDGTVSHAANSNGSGAVIFNKAKNKENAWKFINWFTETETQVRFGTRIEGLLGTMGRFSTANTEALKRLSWSEGELEKLEAQQNELEEIPVIPSSYMVTRNIMNAFREVVNEGENPRDTLIWYNLDINDEIKRKNKELK